jgi:FkbM family methyltransferase
MIYLQPRTTIQDMYYRFWEKAGEGARLLPIDGNRYLTEYVLLREFHKHLHPFQFIAPDSNVVQVGSTHFNIKLGVSQPLIMSSLVGPRGRVLVIEPHEVNVAPLEDFLRQYGVENTTVAKYAAWSRPDTLTINTWTFTGANTMHEVEERSRREQGIGGPSAPPAAASRFRPGVRALFRRARTELKRRWRQESDEGFAQVTVSADTIDALASRHLPGPVSFVNVTINGAEPDAVEGLHGLMERHPEMNISTVLIQPRHKHYATRRRLLDTLQREGYDICVADASVLPWFRPRSGAPFLYAVATRAGEAKLKGMGFERAPREWVERNMPVVPAPSA